MDFTVVEMISHSAVYVTILYHHFFSSFFRAFPNHFDESKLFRGDAKKLKVCLHI